MSRGSRPRNVWIAAATVEGAGPVLRSLLPVQAFAGEGPPFRRLALPRGDGGNGEGWIAAHT